MLSNLKEALEKRAVIFCVLLIFIVVFPFVILRWLHAIAFNVDKAWDISKAMDRAANVLCNGNWQEMISTRAGRSMQEGRTWACILCKLLDKLEKDHCLKSKG